MVVITFGYEFPQSLRPCFPIARQRGIDSAQRETATSTRFRYVTVGKIGSGYGGGGGKIKVRGKYRALTASPHRNQEKGFRGFCSYSEGKIQESLLGSIFVMVKRNEKLFTGS